MKRSILLVCFFLSGAAGLVYEVLWTRILALAFGHTVWALTTVLAVFMGGLALGSLAIGRLADRSRDPARLYALLETGIGVYCLAAPFLLEASRHVHLAVSPVLGQTLFSRTLSQFLLAVLVLIVPTTLMGGTVPVMARAIIPGPAAAGRRFGLLYGANTLGAAAGAFAAGYWLLPSVGMQATNVLAAVVNVSIGAVLLLSGRVARKEKGTETVPPQEATEPAPPSIPVPERALRWAFVVTGGAAMIFQVAWVRSLILVIGSSTYGYSAILVTFLLGIAIGSFLFTRVRTAGPALVAALLAGIAASGLLLLPFFNFLPGLFLALFKGFTGNYAYIQFVQFLVVFPVILVPTVFMGMSLPCLTGLVLQDGERIGKDVGRFYAFNTAGAIFGSVLAGFALIPGIGSQKTIAVGIFLELLTSAVFLSMARPAWRNIVYAASVALGLAAFAMPAWEKMVMYVSVSVYPDPSAGPKNYSVVRREWSENILFHEEGISSNVAVFGYADGPRWFTVNGKTDGGTGDMEPQVKVAMFPMLFCPGARRIAVLGLGTGITAGAVALFEGVESIDIVELEPAVVGVARFFERENCGILSDPRARLHIDDGRSFFASRRGSYDVVISEPSNPWMYGVANLYTVESFREIRGSLAPGGVFGMWVQAHMMSLESYRLAVRTFLDVFPDATLWQVSPADTLLIGRKGGEGPPDVASLKRRLRGSPRLSAAFGISGELPFEPVFLSFLLGSGEMRRFAGEGELNTDDRNLLEFWAPRSMYRQELNRILWEVVQHRQPVLPPFLRDPEAEGAAFHLRAGEGHNQHGYIALALWEFGRLPSLAPQQAVRKEDGPARLRDGGVVEDFEGPGKVPFIPAAGPVRPEAGDRESSLDWQADLAHLTRTSGVVRGAGRGGGAGLALKSVRTSPSGYLVPLEVEPAAEYEVRCWMKGDVRTDGTAGIAVWEYDTPEEEGTQPSASFNQRHNVRNIMAVERKGSQGWSPVSFRFRTSPKTALVRIFFFLDGKQGSSVAFDEISVKRIR